MTAFDDTYTEPDFKRRIDVAEQDWMRKVARREPDLDVDGLDNTLLARLTRMFTPNKR